MAIDWGRLGAGLQGFSQGFFPAYEAIPLRRYRQAQTQELIQKQEYLKLLAELEQPQATVPVSRRVSTPPPTGITPPAGIQIGALSGGNDLKRRLLGSQERRPQGQFPQPTVSFGQERPISAIGEALTRAFQPSPIRGQLPPSDQGMFGTATERDQPPPLLRQLRKAGFAQPLVQETGTIPGRPITGVHPSVPVEEPTQYGFIQSGTPQARQVVGNGADIVSQLPDKSFAGEQPLYQSGTREGQFSIPPRFDPLEERKRVLRELAGLPTRPQHETDEYQLVMPFLTQLSEKLADITTAKPTSLKYTNAAGQSVETFTNLDLLLNAPMFELARDIPGVGDLLTEMNLSGRLGPTASLDGVATNNYQVDKNASVDEIVGHATTSPMDAHNPVQRFIRVNPLSPRFETSGPFGRSITTVDIPEQSRRVLENMVPIANVAQQIGDLALSLNTAETRFLAGLQGAGQTIDSWFGTTWFTPDDLEPMTEAEVNGLWNKMNPGSTGTARARGLDRIRQLSKLRHAYAGIFAEMGGERGRKTEEDVKRALQMVPGAGETRQLTETMLNTLFTNMINTYESITKGVVVTLGDFGLVLEGPPGQERYRSVIQGGVMGDIQNLRDQIERQRRDPNRVVSDPDVREKQENDGGYGRGQVRSQNR